MELSQGEIFEALESNNYNVICNALLKKSLDAYNWKTPNGGSILHMAAMFGNFQVIIFVPKELLMQADENGDTALIIASRRGNAEFVSTLLKEVKKLSYAIEDVGSSATPMERYLRFANKEGNTALHESVKGGYVDVVRLLISEDKDIIYPCNVFEESPLFLAAERGDDDVLSVLIDYSSGLLSKGPKGVTALHVAVCYDFQEVVSNLLSYDKELIKGQDDQGWGVMHYAASEGLVAMVKFLVVIDKSIILMKDVNGVSPLHIAVSKGFLDIVKIFLSEAPDSCFLVDSQLRSILHYSVLHKQNEVLGYLLKQNWCQALINQKDCDGNSPLFLAVRHNHVPSAKALLKHSEIDVGGRNKGGKAVMDIVSSNSPSHFLLLQKNAIHWLLRKHGARPSINEVQESCVNLQNLIDLEEANDEVESLVMNEIQKKADTHIFVAILIATLAFPATYSVYGIYNNKEKHSRSEVGFFYSFLVSNGLSMLFSVAAIMAYLFMPSLIKRSRRSLFKAHFVSARYLTIASVGAMSVAFATASMTLLPLALGVVACVLSVPFFILYLAFIKKHNDF